MCPNDAAGIVEHSILGAVPTCESCAEKLSLELIRGEVVAL
jgi:hypothetical protein